MSASNVTFKLRTWRRNNGLSQAGAAARIGVARRTWHLWENASTIPAPEHMARLVDLTEGAIEPNDFYRPTLDRKDAA
jgi:DNA-binding XRE family transcriptional regulator